jgi:RNA polymerase sigma-70 factor (ECF subfamily)
MKENPSQAFMTVVEDHKALIYKIARMYAHNSEDQNDLVQEIIFQLWHSFEKYDPAFRWSTWIYRIALNVSISFYRREKQRQKLSAPMPEHVFQIENEENTLQEDIRLLYQFIRELKEIDRALIILSLDGNSQKEIAGILGLNETNVSTRIARIKNRLKQKFESFKNK